MTKGMRLLSNGEEADIYDDMSEGDYLAEVAFLDGRSGYSKPQAAGLGQPNGYIKENEDGNRFSGWTGWFAMC
jgi:hypothetical protein